MPRIKVLVACRSENVGDAVAKRLRSRGGFDVSVRVSTNGHADPLHGLQARPDLLILHHVPGCGELEHLASLGTQQRVPLLVFGPDDAAAMRFAIRAGASDYLPEPLSEQDLFASLDRISSELSRQPGDGGSVLTVINSKGGSGASFVAANLGCALAESSRRTILADLDLQFGCQTRYLDLHPERGLPEALDALGDLDGAAVEAFVASHKSGLKLLAAPAARPFQQPSVAPEQIDALLQVFARHSQHVVVDLPHYVDGISTTVLERSERILVIVQQSVAHLNGAARLMQVIHEDLGMRRDCMDVVLNRYVRNSIIELADVRKTLRVDQVHVIPNQYKAVSDSLDSGHPVVSGARSSAVAKSLRQLASRVGDLDKDGDRTSGFLARALPNFLGAN